MENDNGILDIETINNELMEQRNINTKPESSEVLNTETSMNSGTMNPSVSAPAAIEPVNPAMPEPAAMEPTNPVMPDFRDLEIQDNFQNFDQTIMPETIDSRSFTHTAEDWKRIQEEDKDNYVDPADAGDDYIENKPQNFFQVFFAFLVSIIIAGVFVLINVIFYNIEYLSTLQWLMSMLPAMGLFYGFYYIAGRRNTTAVVGVLLLVLNEFISYFMFHAVMAHNLKEMYAELSYKEAWDFVNMIKMVTETRGLYYEHFFSIFGVNSLSGIVLGWWPTMLDAGVIKGYRHR